MSEKSLTEIVNESGLEQTKSHYLLQHFQKFFEEAKTFEKQAKEIVVTNATQVHEMKRAREIRLQLKDIRINADKVRKGLKEQIVREGKAIDGVANVIKALVEPMEEYLENQEKFAEVQQAKEREIRQRDRESKLLQYVDDVSMYNLADMTEEGFTKLLELTKEAFIARRDAELKAQEEAEEKAKKDKEEAERIKKEHEILKKEKEERDAKEKAERDAREKKEAEERAKAEDEKKRVEAEHQKKLSEERQAREKLEREIKEKQEAEAKAKKEEEARLQKEAEEKAEKERQSRIAPDKDKLFNLSEVIKNISTPQDLSPKAQSIVLEAEKKLLAISQEIKEKIKSL